MLLTMIDYEELKKERDKSREALARMKEIERSQKYMFKKVLWDGTVVFCNKEENLERYDSGRCRLW